MPLDKDVLDRTPPEVIRARQLTALQAQLRHAFATVPYYRRTWAAAGVHPDDVKSLDDLRHFPVLTKAGVPVSTGQAPAKAIEKDRQQVVERQEGPDSA